MVIVLFLLFQVFVDCVFQDYAVEFRQVDVFALGVVRQRNWIFVLGALAQLLVLFIFVAVIIVRFGEAVR